MALSDVRCPGCGARELSETAQTIISGNPLSPASDVEMEVHYQCGGCSQRYWAVRHVTGPQDADALHIAQDAPEAPVEAAPVAQVASPPAAEPSKPRRKRSPKPLTYDYCESYGRIERLRRGLSKRFTAARRGEEPAADVARDLNYVYDFYGANDSYSRAITFVVTATRTELGFIRWLEEHHPELHRGTMVVLQDA